MNRYWLPKIVRRFATLAALATAVSTPAAAQTLRLTDSAATTLRDGSYADTNLSAATTLATRVGSSSYNRRVQLKFDTHTTIPQGTPVASAYLTLTVAPGSNGETRQLTAYQGAYSYDEWQVTWNARKAGLGWPSPGGHAGDVAARATVTGTAGTKVTFDVTDTLRKIVDGTYGSSRYARFLIVDTGADSRESYKQYYSDEASDPSLRPVLTITLGSSSSTSTPTSDSTSSTSDDTSTSTTTSTSTNTSTSTSTSTSSSAESLRITDSAATTLRDGSYANTNLSSKDVLETRAGSYGYNRRIQLKYDTHNTIPQGTSIASATLTLTTAAGSNTETRKLTAYRGAYSYDVWATTWNSRKSGLAWPTPGGDGSDVAATQTATGAAGAKVTFDVTATVQNIVKGTYGSSRYARFLIVDTGASSRSSYKQFHSDEAVDPSLRPVLTITFGTSTSSGDTTTSPEPAPAPAPAPEPVPSTSTGTLKVLHWNIHHGFTSTNAYAVDRQAAFIANTGAEVVSLNEVERYTGWGYEDMPAKFAALLRQYTGRTWYYHFVQQAGGSTGVGNTLLSVYPIEARGSHYLSYTRAVAQVTINVNGRTVNLFSTHLDAYSSAYRSTQIKELKRLMLSYAENRIVAGDFNAWPGAGEITLMTSDYHDVWAQAQAAGTAVAYPGNEAGNTRNSRIDYVWLSRGAGSAAVTGSRVYDVRDPNTGIMLSDHRPLMAVVEIR